MRFLRSPAASRRRFLRTIGLGAGSALLAPIASRLHRRAFAQAGVEPGRLIVFLNYAMNKPTFRPSPYAGGPERVGDAVEDGDTSGWATMFDPLMPYHDQMVLLDGLELHRGDTGDRHHRCGSTTLSGTWPRSEPNGMPAPGPTLDHVAGSALQGDAPLPVLRWGFSGDSLRERRARSFSSFARHDDVRLETPTSAAALAESFGPGMSEAPGGALPTVPLRDVLLADLRQLSRNLAPEERFALDDYEAAILGYDQRMEAIATRNCDHPTLEDSWHPSDQLDAMMAQTHLALSCGLTNVVGICIGHSDSHEQHYPVYREVEPLAGDDGYVFLHNENPRELGAIVAKSNEVNMSAIRGLWDELPPGTREHTALLYLATNGHIEDGAKHHSRAAHMGYPAMLLAGNETGFRTGGRYLRYPLERTVPALLRAVLQGVGVPPGDFGREYAGGDVLEDILLPGVLSPRA